MGVLRLTVVASASAGYEHINHLARFRKVAKPPVAPARWKTSDALNSTSFTPRSAPLAFPPYTIAKSMNGHSWKGVDYFHLRSNVARLRNSRIFIAA